MKFRTKIRNNGIVHTSEIIEYLKTINSDHYIELTISDVNNKRGLEQNRRYWLLLELASEQSGYDKLELHDMMRYKFLGTRDFNIEGKELVELNSSSKLNVKEFGEYLMKVEGYLLQHLNVHLPTPLEL